MSPEADGNGRAGRERRPAADRLHEIRREIAAGRYEVSPRLVAEAMLRSGVIRPPGRSAPRG